MHPSYGSLNLLIIHIPVGSQTRGRNFGDGLLVLGNSLPGFKRSLYEVRQRNRNIRGVGLVKLKKRSGLHSSMQKIDGPWTQAPVFVDRQHKHIRSA